MGILCRIGVGRLVHLCTACHVNPSIVGPVPTGVGGPLGRCWNRWDYSGFVPEAQSESTLCAFGPEVWTPKCGRARRLAGSVESRCFEPSPVAKTRVFFVQWQCLRTGWYRAAAAHPSN